MSGGARHDRPPRVDGRWKRLARRSSVSSLLIASAVVDLLLFLAVALFPADLQVASFGDVHDLIALAASLGTEVTPSLDTLFSAATTVLVALYVAVITGQMRATDGDVRLQRADLAFSAQIGAAVFQALCLLHLVAVVHEDHPKRSVLVDLVETGLIYVLTCELGLLEPIDLEQALRQNEADLCDNRDRIRHTALRLRGMASPRRGIALFNLLLVGISLSPAISVVLDGRLQPAIALFVISAINCAGAVAYLGSRLRESKALARVLRVLTLAVFLFTTLMSVALLVFGGGWSVAVPLFAAAVGPMAALNIAPFRSVVRGAICWYGVALDLRAARRVRREIMEVVGGLESRLIRGVRDTDQIAPRT